MPKRDAWRHRQRLVAEGSLHGYYDALTKVRIAAKSEAMAISREVTPCRRKRYGAILVMPAWTNDELDDLQWAMKHYVLAGMEQKNVLQQRLAWRNTSNSSYVKIAKIRFGLRANGLNTAE